MNNKIKMIKTFKGSPNGISINVYEKNKYYEIEKDIPEKLAKIFIDLEVACYETDIATEQEIQKLIKDTKKQEEPIISKTINKKKKYNRTNKQE